MDGFTLSQYADKGRTLFFVGDQPIRHRVRRRTTEDDEKDGCIVETVRTVKYTGHRLEHLSEAYKGAKDLSLAPFFLRSR